MRKWFKIKWLQWKHRNNQFPASKYIIKPAFTAGGVEYFQFDDVFNVPFQRGLEAIAVYEEVRMKCSREYILAHAEAHKAIYAKPKVGLAEFGKLMQMNEQLLERLNWIVDTDLVYKLASVVFFDATEKPERYEAKYAHEKIARWKENEDINAFFLREPLRRLIPFLDGSDLNFQTYSKAQQAITRQHLENIYGNLPQIAATPPSAV